MSSLQFNNDEAEQSVLGAVMLDPSAINRVTDMLKAEDFHRKGNAYLFDVMLSLSDDGEPIDLVTLSSRLTAEGRLQEVGGNSYLQGLMEATPTAATVRHYAKLVKECSLTRQISKAGGQIPYKAQEFEKVSDYLDYAEQSILAIRAKAGARTSVFDMRELCREESKALRKRVEDKRPITGLSTGYRDIDRITSGLQGGDMVVLAARPSMGKTAFALNLVENISARYGNKAALVFSLEMSKEQLTQRMISSMARVDFQRYKTGQLGEGDFNRINSAFEALHKAPILIDDTSAPTALELKSKARRVAKEHDLGLIVVDYLQLIEPPNNKNMNGAQAVGQISRSMKQMAKELNVPVLVLSQLNRKLEERQNKRPIMSDLRESGAIEQDADVIMFIYREPVYCDDCKDTKLVCSKGHERDAEIIFAKQRNGPIGTVHMAFFGPITRFEGVTGEEE